MSNSWCYTVIAGLVAAGSCEVSASDWPAIVFDAEIAAIKGDQTLAPEGLAAGDMRTVTLTPPEVDWAHRYSSVLRDMTIVGDELRLEGPFSNVGLNNYTFIVGDPSYVGFALSCHSNTDAEGCSIGSWSNGPPYYSWTAEMLLGVAESRLGQPESAQWPTYMLATEAWNNDELPRTFKIDVWEGRGGIDEPVLTIEAIVGEVSLAVPEPGALAMLLTLVAAMLNPWSWQR